MHQAVSLPNRIKEFYERVSVERGAALVDLAALYSDDVHFINPVVDQHGIEAFKEAWVTGLRKYKVFPGRNRVASWEPGLATGTMLAWRAASC